MMAETLAQLTSLDPLRATLSSRQKAETAAGEELAKSAKAKGELQGLQQEMESKRGAEKAQQVARLEQDYAKSVAEAPQREEMKAVTQEMAKPFIPSKENAQDMAALFSLINVVGFALGRGGKGNAQAAMSAMNGMLEGHRAGREDVYKKELKQFDLNLKQLKTRFDTLDRDLKDALETYKTNKAAGMAAADEAYAKAGADFYKQYADKYGIAAMYELHKQNMTAAQRAVDKADKELVEAERKNLQIQHQREREAAAERRHRENLAAKGPPKSATQQTFIAQRAVNALGGVVSAAEGLMNLPSGTTLEILPNLQTREGMISYMKNAAGRKMSSGEAKAMETLFTGVTRNLAAIEASGAATGLVGLSGQLEKLRPVAGDTAADVALKMADIRRIATENIEPLISSGLLPKEQRETAEKLVSRIQKAIPFTTQEVIDAAYGRKGKQTIGESGAQLVGGGKSYKTEADAEAAFGRGELKAGDKVTIGGVSGTWR